MDTAAELTLRAGNPNYHRGLFDKVETYRDQIINAFLLEVQLTVGPPLPWTHSMIIFQVSRYIIGNDIPDN